jgi:uncharacterized Zn-finger protein
MVQCSKCQRHFTRQSSLKRHLTSAHGIEVDRHVCGECDKTFSRRDFVVRHKRRYRSEDSLVCATCSRRFRQKDRLRQDQKACDSAERSMPSDERSSANFENDNCTQSPTRDASYHEACNGSQQFTRTADSQSDVDRPTTTEMTIDYSSEMHIRRALDTPP